MATVEEAIDALAQLGFPRQQLNERSGLVLLALLGLTPDKPWDRATQPLCGVTPMMDFMAEHYGKVYAPNSRETVRRQTVHQFQAAALLIQNPDQPDRPTNSGKTTYQVSGLALKLLRTYRTAEWSEKLERYQLRVEPLKERWAKERIIQRIPVVLPDGAEIMLSPGGQNLLIARLIEAVTSHGPVDAKRHEELQALFAASSAGLVFVTSFLDRRTMSKYVSDISWETEVWVAESPTHLIHFNGERFLGPY